MLPAHNAPSTSTRVTMHIDKKVVEKAAQTLLAKAEQCFELAKSEHELETNLHEVAARQIDNADKQKEIAAKQHRSADRLAATANNLENLGQALEASAVEVIGDTAVVPKGR